MVKVLIFATLAAIGNAVFVYGQRGASESKNPFLFILGAVALCTFLFLASTTIYKSTGNIAYLTANYKYIAISGIGFFLTFLGFYLLYSGAGASVYIVYAVISIITTSIGVGVFVYREPFNVYHFASLVCSIMTIAFFSYGQYVAVVDKEVKNETSSVNNLKTLNK